MSRLEEAYERAVSAEESNIRLRVASALQTLSLEASEFVDTTSFDLDQAKIRAAAEDRVIHRLERLLFGY